MPLTTVTIVGTYRRADNTPAAGSVEFLLSARSLSTADNLMLTRVPIVGVLNSSGTFSVVLVATDQTVISPTNLTYRVTERIDGARKTSFNIEVPVASGGSTIDLADIVPVVSVTASSPYVLTATFNAHTALTTGAHGGLVATNDSRLSDARPASSVTSAVLGTGTADSTKYLSGDRTWRSVGGSGLGNALSVAFDPRGNISATNVQAAIEELDAEKTTAEVTQSGFHNVSNASTSVGAGVFTDISQRLPTLLPVGTTRWRLIIRNFQSRLNGETAFPNALAFTGVWVGKQLLSSGAGTASFTATPTQAVGAFSTPADGSAYTTPWVTASAAQFEAGVPMLLSMGWTCAAGTDTAQGFGGSFYDYGAGRAATSPQLAVPATTHLASSASWLDIILEYEFVAVRRPLLLTIGDSNTEGTNAVQVGSSLFSWPALMARRDRLNLVNGALSSSFLSDWAADITDNKWTRLGISARGIDDAIVMLGTNDISGAQPLAQMKTDVGTITGYLRSLGVANVRWATVIPRSSFDDAANFKRLEFNDWLRTLPHGIAGVLDFAEAVADKGDNTIIDPRWTTDGTHLNAAGHNRVVNEVGSVTTGNIFNPRSYGAKMNAAVGNQMTTTSGSNIVTIPGGTTNGGWNFNHIKTTDLPIPISLSSAGSGGAALTTTITQVDSATQARIAVNASTSGNSGFGIGTNDSAAFVSACQAVRDAGGGTVIIDGPMRIASTNSIFFGQTYPHSLTIKSEGAGAFVLVDNTAAAEVMAFYNGYQVVMDGVTFIGVPGRTTDCLTLLNFLSTRQAVLNNCHFIGLGAGSAANGLVRIAGGHLAMENSHFWGCYAAGGPVVRIADAWLGFDAHNVEFLDFTTWRGILLGKTAQAGTLTSAWIRVGNTNAIVSTANQRGIYLSHVTGDEGALALLKVDPVPASSGRIAVVKLDRCLMNVMSQPNSAGVDVYYADRVEISNSWFGYTAQTHDGVKLRDVTVAEITGTKFASGAATINVDSTVGLLRLRNVTGHTISGKPGRLQKDDEVPFGVKSYGGAVGDAVVDDSLSIDATIAAAGVGGTVIFEKGTYRLLNKSVQPLTGQTLIFSEGATLKADPYVSAGQTGIVNSYNRGHIEIVNKTDVTLVNPRIDGSRETTNGGRLFGIHIIANSKRIKVQGGFIRQCPSEGSGISYGDGIYIGQFDSYRGIPEDILIDSVTVDGCGRQNITVTHGRRVKVVNCSSNNAASSGIDLEPNYTGDACEDILVANNQFGLSRIGINLSSGGTGRWIIDNNQITMATAYGGDTDAIVCYSPRATITNNQIKNGKFGIMIVGIAPSSGGAYAVCRGNTIQSCKVGIRNTANYCVVEGNVILDCRDHGIVIDGEVEDAVGGVVSGNVLVDCNDPVNATAPADSFILLDRSPSRLVVTNNNLTDTRAGAARAAYGISVTSTAANEHLTHNIWGNRIHNMRVTGITEASGFNSQYISNVDAHRFTGVMTFTERVDVQKNATGIFRVLSGAAAPTSMQIGRTGPDGTIAVPSGGGQFLNSVAAGDLVLLTEAIANRVRIGSGGTTNISAGDDDIGFLGATPVTKRTVGAAASDAATTQTLANNLRQALIDLGLAQT